MLSGTPTRRTRPDVYDELRRLIVRGRLAPGARITEAAAAERLGVSRTPVREALQRLQRDGLLVPAGALKRVQLAVAPMTREDLTELYHMAGALEGAAARAIAGQPATARRALARALRATTQAFAGAASRPAAAMDFDELFERHNAFHDALMAASAGRRVLAFLDTIRPQLDRYEWLYAPLVGPDFTPTIAEHAAIAQAVRSGTAREIEDAVRANWWNGAERLSRVIDRLGDRGTW